MRCGVGAGAGVEAGVKSESDQPGVMLHLPVRLLVGREGEGGGGRGEKNEMIRFVHQADLSGASVSPLPHAVEWLLSAV